MMTPHWPCKTFEDLLRIWPRAVPAGFQDWGAQNVPNLVKNPRKRRILTPGLHLRILKNNPLGSQDFSGQPSLAGSHFTSKGGGYF